MNTSELENYLFESIPIAKFLGMKVLAVTPEHVSISAAMEPNKNHLDKVFGGSSSMVCILTAWSLLHQYVAGHQLDGQIVIRKQTVNYFKPITTDFKCNAFFNDDVDWLAFESKFKQFNKAKLEITARIFQDDELAVEFNGTFVLLKS